MTRADNSPTVVSNSGAPEEAYCPACSASYAPDANVCPHDGARLVKLKAQGDPMLGRVLDARYEVRSPLGEGGMGTVYRGLQLSVDREVAIKVIHAAYASDRTSVKRFLREARLSSRLAQPSIVNVYDFGQTEDGVLYLVMELLRGRTLAAEIDKGQPLAVKRVAGIALQLCDALESAHLQGIIHRDLKPGNIIVLDDPPGRDLVKVLDFGLAKSLVAESTTRVTMSNALLGTPLYMAPEQVMGADADQRADLYALGCIMFHLLVGRPPYMGGSVNVVLAAHVHDPIPELPAHVPSALAQTIRRLLAKDPAARVQSAGEVRDVLQTVLASASAPSDPSESLATVLLLKNPKTPRAAIEAPRAKRKRPWGIIGAVLAALVAIPIIVLATSGGSEPEPAKAPIVEPAKPAAITTTPLPVTEPTATVKSEPPPTKQAEPPRKAEKQKSTEKPKAAAATEPPKPAAEPPKPAVTKPAEPSIDFYPSKTKK